MMWFITPKAVIYFLYFTIHNFLNFPIYNNNNGMLWICASILYIIVLVLISLEDTFICLFNSTLFFFTYTCFAKRNQHISLYCGNVSLIFKTDKKWREVKGRYHIWFYEILLKSKSNSGNLFQIFNYKNILVCVTLLKKHILIFELNQFLKLFLFFNYISISINLLFTPYLIYKVSTLGVDFFYNKLAVVH